MSVIQVQESDLAGVLLGAETLQVKGLSNVRNKYEKGQIKGCETAEEHLDSRSLLPSLSTKVKPATDPFKARKRVHKNSTVSMFFNICPVESILIEQDQYLKLYNNHLVCHRIFIILYFIGFCKTLVMEQSLDFTSRQCIKHILK